MLYHRKKVLSMLVAVKILGSQCAMAETIPSIPGASAGFDGFYAGLYPLGLMYENVSETYTDSLGEGQVKTKKYGYIGGGFAGYLMEIGASRTMVGLETFVLGANTKFSSDFGVDGETVYGKSTTQRKSSVGVSAILAKMFNVRTLLFLKIGFETINYSIDLKYDPDTNAAFPGKTKTLQPKFSGATLGFGCDYRVTRSVVVGAEYVFAGLFRKKKLIIDKSFPDSVLTMKPTEHKLLLRVSYRFGLIV